MSGDTLRVIERTLPVEPVSDEADAGNAEFDEAMQRWPGGFLQPPELQPA